MYSERLERRSKVDQERIDFYHLDAVYERLEAAVTPEQMEAIIEDATDLEGLNNNETRIAVGGAIMAALEQHQRYVNDRRRPEVSSDALEDTRQLAMNYTDLARFIGLGSRHKIKTLTLTNAEKSKAVAVDEYKRQFAQSLERYRTEIEFSHDAVSSFLDSFAYATEEDIAEVIDIKPEVSKRNFREAIMGINRPRAAAIGLLGAASMTWAVPPSVAAEVPLPDLSEMPRVSPVSFEYPESSESSSIIVTPQGLLPGIDVPMAPSLAPEAPDANTAEDSSAAQSQRVDEEVAPEQSSTGVLPGFDAIAPSLMPEAPDTDDSRDIDPTQTPEEPAVEPALGALPGFELPPSLAPEQPAEPAQPERPSEPQFIPAQPPAPAPPRPAPAPAERPAAPELSEEQLGIAASDRLMKRGGEWHNIGYVMRCLIEHGDLPPRVAAAFVGNFQVESPGLDPGKVQEGGGPGMGIAQWTNTERWAVLVGWAQGQGFDPFTLEAQCKFVIHELNTAESNAKVQIMDAYARGVSRDDLVDYVRVYYERPNPNYAHMDRRISEATRAANAFNEELNNFKREKGMSVQSSSIEILPQTNYQDMSGRTVRDAIDEEFFAAQALNNIESQPVVERDRMAEKATYAVDHLTKHTDLHPFAVTAIVGNLIYDTQKDNAQAEEVEGFVFRKSALKDRWYAYAAERGLDVNDITAQMTFITEDLKGNSWAAAKRIDKAARSAEKASLSDATVAAAANYVKPYLRNDTERIQTAKTLWKSLNEA